MVDHTPGPWALSAFDTTTVIVVKDGPNQAGQEFRDGRHQYTICRAGDVPDIYERMANAALMARAPDMADEIERLRAEVRELRRFGNKDCTKMADAELERLGVQITADY